MRFPFGLGLSNHRFACDLRCGPEGSALPGLRGAARRLAGAETGHARNGFDRLGPKGRGAGEGFGKLGSNPRALRSPSDARAR